MKRRLASSLIVLAILPAALTGCLIVEGGDSTFTVTNFSESEIDELRITEAGNPDFGPNLLRGLSLLPGESITIDFIDCDFYDVRVVDEFGAVCDILDIELCFDDAEWVITESELASCPAFARNVAAKKAAAKAKADADAADAGASK